ncbi:ABC transporter permease [Clostridium cellulovorans]|uniref:Inner-membrane translocator n=1 Tax=Clostridium cellulovorans (strain ATCC 35296 / DSM 3052 / OCM 3 / 743B) TaxID=573061 RepID=D9SVM0_CLOC7|nr:ABC transporter permease [Clostridium cellulovorans]ADL51144.1 inner-membrane translocator [Clostridium cellulovorans 743B]
MIRFIKREDIKKGTELKIRAVAIILALLLAAIFLIFLNFNPISVFAAMFKGAFGSPRRIGETIEKAIPILIAALGCGVAFKMKYWNIGGEGQILMGAVGATFFALNFSNLPSIILIPIMMLAGILCGGLWALITGVLKVRFNTNETIMTLMMNYVALKLVTYLQFQRWKDPSAKGMPKIASFEKSAILPEVFGIHIGWIIAVGLVVAYYFFMKHSKKGYEIAVLGESENTAKYAGINITKTVLFAVFLSGAICGIAGVIQASAVSQTLSTQVTGNAGNTAIIVSWLANLSGPVIVVASILFAALVEGGSYIQTAFGIPDAAASVIQALILFFVLGSEFFARYKLVFTKKQQLKEEVAK